jgi:hypothetical protein
MSIAVPITPMISPPLRSGPIVMRRCLPRYSL